jgi:hypothetical protein
MDMSFKEKSAWGSLLALAVASGLFFPMAISHVAAGGEPVDLIFRVFFVIGVIIVIEIVYHAVASVSAKNRETDERDVMINMKADRISGYVLGFGVVWIAGAAFIQSAVPWAPAAPSSTMMSIYLFLALTVSEASKCLLQIWFYRSES